LRQAKFRTIKSSHHLKNYQTQFIFQSEFMNNKL